MSLLNFIKSKTFLKQLGIAIVGLLLFIFLMIQWLKITTNHTQKIQVPDLSKMTISEVKAKLDELNLDLKILDSVNYKPDYPPLSVVEQDPEAGDFVKENRKIYLKINRPTYQDIRLPNVLKKSRRNAEAVLRAVGFRIGKNPKYVPDIARNVVRGLYYKGKTIKVGDKLPKNSVIDLKLGDGRGR